MMDIQELQQTQNSLQQCYFQQVQKILEPSYSDCTWEDLYQDIAGDKWTGSALDKWVMRLLLKQKPVEQAMEVLTQSPYLQWHIQQGQVSNRDFKGYVKKIISDALDE